MHPHLPLITSHTPHHRARHKALRCGTVLLLGLLAACTVYTAKPLDLQRNTAEWLTLSRKLCAKPALSLADLHNIGLMLNPDLNKARLTYAKSTSIAEFAGLWEDPSLSTELAYTLSPYATGQTYNPGLTLPVTGLPALASKIAEQYKEADYWTMRTQERDFLKQLDTLRHRIMVSHAKQQLMRTRLTRLRDEEEKIAKLYELGEVEFAEFKLANQRTFDATKALQELDNLHLQQHLELVNLLGLHPDMRDIELQGSLPRELPAALPVADGDALLESPELKALMASYGAGEQELRREIRRQYPELSLSMGWERADDVDKLKLTIGFNIPLWNRNREAIAAANAERDIRHHDAISQWRALLRNAAALSDRQQLALQHCREEFTNLGVLRDAEQRQEALFAIGEIGMPALAGSRQEVFERHINYLDCLEQLLDVQTQILYLNPFHKP